MGTKEMKIVPPEGYEIDKENSTFECIKFKPIKEAKTYYDVAVKMFFDRGFSFIYKNGAIEKSYGCSKTAALDPSNCTSRKQAEKLLAINKMMNVEKYLRKTKEDGYLYHIFIDEQGNIMISNHYPNVELYFVTFKSLEAAKQAIDILGEETIRLALSTDW